MLSDKEEGNNEDESEVEEESILEVKKTEVVVRVIQGAERQSLRDVKEEEESHGEPKEHHTDEILEGNQVESEWLRFSLEEFENEKEIVDNKMELVQTIVAIEIDTSFQNLIMLTSILENVDDYLTAVKVLEGNLPFDSKFANKE